MDLRGRDFVTLAIPKALGTSAAPGTSGTAAKKAFS